MQKIVINRCYGGFGLSYKAMMLYAQKMGFKLFAYGEPEYGKGYKPLVPEQVEKAFLVHYSTAELPQGAGTLKSNEKLLNDNYFTERDIRRNDPILVEVVEELGQEADNKFAELKVVEIPDDVEWEINEYDGMETVAERHRAWN